MLLEVDEEDDAAGFLGVTMGRNVDGFIELKHVGLINRILKLWPWTPSWQQINGLLLNMAKCRISLAMMSNLIQVFAP